MSEQQDPETTGRSPFEEAASSLEEQIRDPEFLQTHLDAYERARTETREAYEELLRRIQVTPARRINPLYYYISGAAAAVLLAVAGYFFMHPVHNTPTLSALPVTSEAKAITFSTHAGQRTHMVLPDGSQVWLNAGSRLTYLARQATLEGEAYFDIATDKTAPFHLAAGGTETVVLGTAFDVKAYKEDAKVAITLLQGSVKVAFSGKSATLQPGQTALASSGTLTRQNDPDASSAIAWKDGFFNFNAPLDEVARELGRWYDVDVKFDKGLVYKDTVIDKTSRDLPLDRVIHHLEEIGAGHFKLEGKTLTVLP